MFSKLRNRLRRRNPVQPTRIKADDLYRHIIWLDAPSLEFCSKAYAGNEWISTAVNRLASLSVSTDLEVRSNDGLELVPNHPILKFIGRYGRPNDSSDSHSFLESHFRRMLIYGNDIWYWSIIGDNPVALYQLPLENIELEIKDGAPIYRYRTVRGRIQLEFDKLIHFKLPNPIRPLSFWGLSPAVTLQLSIALEQNMTHWNTQFFDRGGPSGILFVDHDSVTQEEARLVEHDLYNRFTGQRRVAVIRAPASSASWQVANFEHREMEFIDGRKLNRQSAFDHYGFHVGVVSEASTEAHARVSERFVRETAHTAHVRFESTGHRLLQQWTGSEKYQLKFQDVRLIDWDRESRMLAALSPYMTINEIRTKHLGLDSVSWGDQIAKDNSNGHERNTDVAGQNQ